MFSHKGSRTAQQIQESTQKYLEIDQIKNDCLILKDGSLRAVLMVSSINMDLRSEEEQEAIILAYQNALNSLEFPLQILVQSRKVDLTLYLGYLEEAATKHPHGLLRDQTTEYIAFLRQILDNVNVMDKKFFVVIPYFPNIVEEKSKGILGILGGGNKNQTQAQKQTESHEKALKQLNQRAEIACSLLNSTGVAAKPLPTEALIELFYICYNPETAGHEHIKNLGDLGAKYISKRNKLS